MDPAVQRELLAEVTAGAESLRSAAVDLDRTVAAEAAGDLPARAAHMRAAVLPAMTELRRAADRLELLVDDALWPLPTYREMLFIR